MSENSRVHEFTVGLFGIGLDTYWPQFEGLQQRLTGYTQQVADRLEKTGVRVINLGLVDSAEKAEAAPDPDPKTATMFVLPAESEVAPEAMVPDESGAPITLREAINETLKAPEMKELLVKFGSELRIGTPQEFAAFLAGETRKWAGIAKQAGVSLD